MSNSSSHLGNSHEQPKFAEFKIPNQEAIKETTNPEEILSSTERKPMNPGEYRADLAGAGLTQIERNRFDQETLKVRAMLEISQHLQDMRSKFEGSQLELGSDNLVNGPWPPAEEGNDSAMAA